MIVLNFGPCFGMKNICIIEISIRDVDTLHDIEHVSRKATHEKDAT
jgi:hypothetical protein